MLLYRKFAIYYAVTKNNKQKYRDYLYAVRAISLKQTFIIALYVFIKKTAQAISIGFSGLFYFFRLLFK